MIVNAYFLPLNHYPISWPVTSVDHMPVPLRRKPAFFYQFLQFTSCSVRFILLDLPTVQAAGSVVPTKPVIRGSNDNQTCGSLGDYNVYGNGIRIGYYTQIISGSRSRYYRPILNVAIRQWSLRVCDRYQTDMAFRDPRSAFAIEACLLVCASTVSNSVRREGLLLRLLGYSLC